jgi:hypothetical protein
MRICHRAMTIDGEVMSNDNGTTTVRKNSDCRVLAMKLIIISIEFSLDTKYRNRGFQTSCHGDKKKAPTLFVFQQYNDCLSIIIVIIIENQCTIVVDR